MSQRRVVQVGAGGMGRGWLGNLAAHRDRVELVAVVDLRPEVAREALARAGLEGAVVAEDLGRILADLAPDAVIDVTPPESHCDVTIASLEAGAAVLGEKPMAHTIDAARAMVAAADHAGRLYMVSQNYRYNRRLAAYKRLVEETASPVGILNSDFYLGAHFAGFRNAMDSPLILDMAIHTFDAARHLSGADAVSVYCEEFNPSWSWYRGDACATAIFEMTGGLRYTYRGAWCAEGRPTSWDASWRATGPVGSAVWDGRDEIVAETVTEQGGFTSTFAERRAEPVAGMAENIAGSLEQFLDALDGGPTPMGECHDNIKSLAMVFGAMESARSRTRVPVPVV